VAGVISGTSGYDYPEWLGEGRFYPASLAHDRGGWLTYYASRFAAVELNFTYYGETNPEQLEKMVRRVDPARGLYLLEGEYIPQPGFLFFIKAYASLTHQITTDWPQAARKFKADIAPLSASGSLGGVLVQFPSRLHACGELAEYLCGLAEELAGLPLVLEPRHRSWFKPEWRERLAGLPVALCGVDAPRDAQLPLWVEEEGEGAPGQAAAAGQAGGTAPSAGPGFGYLRLHGRREGHWWTGDNASRYEYNYTPEELKRLAGRLLHANQPRMFAMFNNHRHGAAAANALQLADYLAEYEAAFQPQPEK
jgi:uncharacterized protein YecE (DUF72 family)